jgi:hypothetical protein
MNIFQLPNMSEQLGRDNIEIRSHSTLKMRIVLDDSVIVAKESQEKTK